LEIDISHDRRAGEGLSGEPGGVLLVIDDADAADEQSREPEGVDDEKKNDATRAFANDEVTRTGQRPCGQRFWDVPAHRSGVFSGLWHLQLSVGLAGDDIRSRFWRASVSGSKVAGGRCGGRSLLADEIERR
jgi:hypothetical protein